MKCPIDGTTLLMSNRSGIEIDYCPECRGVWLDRGELDKLIEREQAQLDSAQPPHQRDSYDDRRRDSYDDRRRDDRDDRYRDDRYPKKKKKPSSFLGDLFEFGE
ncbi:MAG: zf-TFIIB domain-containing protein [Coriobacteriales bacterium]|jgi:Zn-finger nucleic acid-binding protein|nr:zf-TFIIB domain-containing protein [Coriobacteriales bacterium]